MQELPFVIMYVLDGFKTQEMCDKWWNVKIYSRLLQEFKKICDKAVNNYSHALDF